MKTPSFLLACSILGGLAGADAIPARAGQDVPAVTNGHTVSFRLQRGKVMVPARVNGSEPMSFLLDTGFGITTIHPALADQLDLRRAGSVTIVGIAGEEDAPMYAGAAFDLGGAAYTPRRVAALPSERDRPRRKDGILGASLFRRFIVEIDFRAQEIRLREPATYVYEGNGDVVPLRFKSDTPIFSASLQTPAGTNVSAEFEIDSGCDSGLCLGQDFVAQHGLLETSEGSADVKSGVGGSTRTHNGHVRQFQIGRFALAKPQTDFFLEGSPVNPPLAGHVGLGILREFRIIFDYSRKRVILEK